MPKGFDRYSVFKDSIFNFDVELHPERRTKKSKKEIVDLNQQFRSN
jgi:hypothetical protein